MNFTLCKNRSNYTKRNKQSRNPPLSVHSSQNRTIPRKSPTPLPYERFVGFAKCSKPPTPLPFNERSVGFASVQSLWAFNFGHPCPSLVKGELLLLSFVQPTIEGLPHRTLSFPQPLQKDNNPSPHVCPFYNTSITHKSVHRLISQPLEQLHRKTGAKCRNNSTLPCSDYREIKQQQ